MSEERITIFEYITRNADGSYSTETRASDGTVLIPLMPAPVIFWDDEKCRFYDAALGK